MKTFFELVLLMLMAIVTVESPVNAQMKITPLPELQAEKQVLEVEEQATSDESADDGSGGLSIKQMLAEIEGYQAGDPLCWEMVSPVIDRIRQQGVNLPADEKLQPLFLSEKSLFYRMMSSSSGKAFFKDLAKFPESIDRAERYLRLPNGRQELGFIMTRKGGAEFFTDMVTNQNGRATARMISANSGFQKFDQPTGKIYLASQFVDLIKQMALDADSDAVPDKQTSDREYD